MSHLPLRNASASNKNSTSSTKHSEMQANHQRWNPLDYIIYNRFLNVYKKMISQQNQDFYLEVQNFRHTLKIVFNFCSRLCMHREDLGNLYIPPSKYNEGFYLTEIDCLVMMTGATSMANIIFAINYKNLCNIPKLTTRDSNYHGLGGIVQKACKKYSEKSLLSLLKGTKKQFKCHQSA